MKHKSHSSIIKRLKRAEGHLRAILVMFEDDRPCLELSQQLHAVEKAIANAKRELIHDHIDHCLSDAPENSHDMRDILGELKLLAKYL